MKAQAELYTIKNIRQIAGDGFYFQIIRVTNNLDGKVMYRALPYDDSGARLSLFPTYEHTFLGNVVAYATNEAQPEFREIER